MGFKWYPGIMDSRRLLLFLRLRRSGWRESGNGFPKSIHYKCFVGSPSKSCQPPLTGSRDIWNIMWISVTINKGSARYNSNNWVLEVFLAVSSSGDLIKIYFCRSRHVTPPEVCGENKLWTEPQFPIISRKRKIECFRSTKSLKRGEIMSFCRSSTLRTLS